MKRQSNAMETTLSIESVDVKRTRVCFEDGTGATFVEIDEALYSRQLYVLGHESMKRISASNVLISGLDGLGAEIAKNVILSGVRRVVLHDKQPAALSDLSSQFYLEESDVGRNRAEACHSKFAELNSYVLVERSSRDLTPEYLADFQVVVLCDYLSYDEVLPISDFCHDAHIKFILASTRGLFGQLFCDFGESFYVSDPDGEEPVSSVIESITYDQENGIVTLTDHGSRGFTEGDSVIFREVRGATGLNTCGPVKIKSVISPFAFSIGDTTQYGRYEGGGVATQAKQPLLMSFKSFREALISPEFCISDFAKIDRQPVIHLAFNCLGPFVNFRNGAFPEPRNPKHAKQFVDFCRQEKFSDFQANFDQEVLAIFASQATGDICPMNAVIGGIAAQEVIKAVSGKFTPIKQWFYFDALECLPSGEARKTLTVKECAPLGFRYDAEIAVFGRKFVEKLAKQHVFLVGAGALGCEFLKNWAMMGVGCSPNGMVTVTDMDLIERSNLNRQFLFRNSDLQQPKSERAAAACLKMNPSMNIVAHRNRVGPESEEVYNDDFFLRLDIVVNALDNIEARKYVDSRCVHFHKPLLESGTLGTKGNIQVILPELTESYSSSTDPPEISYPICTIKNFPYAIEHTLQWARELFDTCFKAPMFHAIQYIEDPKYVQKLLETESSSQAHSIVTDIQRLLVTERPKNFQDCVAWARLFWQENFYNQIQQILYSFPPDAVTSEGVKFWSGSKRLPRVIDFSAKNPSHLDFVIAGANLRAQMFGLPQVRDQNAIIEMISRVSVPTFKPQTDGKNNEESDKSDENENEVSLQELVDALPSRESLAGSKFEAIDFEKDDDTNFHMDFIVGASNSRAEVYDIPVADRHKSKGIAGRIIPAIATTTSVVVGLVCLEFYKIVQGHRDLSLYKNGFINLALPLFAFSEPLPPKSSVFNGKKWTLWDRFVIEGEPTLGELIAKFESEQNVKVMMVSAGVVIVFTDLMNAKKQSERKAMRIGPIIESITGKKIPPWQRIISLEICCEDAEGNDLYEVPPLHYVLQAKYPNENA